MIGIMMPDVVGTDEVLTVKAAFDPPSGQYICIVDCLPHAWQRRVSVIAGEVVHDLRSALDHLAWELVLSHSGTPTQRDARKVQFPIRKKRQEWSSEYTVTNMDPANGALLEPEQPFSSSSNPDSHPLAILQDLSNHDKHRVLNSVLVRPFGFSLNNDGTVDGIRVTYDFGSASPRLAVGSELVRVGGLPLGLEDKVSRASSVIPLVLLPHHTDPVFTAIDANTVQQSLNARLNALTDTVEQLVGLFV